MVRRSFEEEFFYSKKELYQIASWVNNLNVGLEFHLIVSIPESEYWNSEYFTLHRNDASNFIKAIEDSIYAGIGIDDTRNIRVDVEKGYNEDGVWYVEVQINETSISNRIDVDIHSAYINQDKEVPEDEGNYN